MKRGLEYVGEYVGVHAVHECVYKGGVNLAVYNILVFGRVYTCVYTL